ncbi:MAG TPA: hypothetical protein VL326_22425 [Kofleriaceae bacterium]|jgi:hypothetical protein|nr:hypothetical protein [Kofleriaceae bacterium]
MRGVAVMLLLASSGCFFDADYRGGHYTCKDGVCPSGLTCSAAQECVELRKDAASDVSDAPSDGPFFDAPPRAATCADPQPFPATGGMAAGSTASRNNLVTAMCSASVMNGKDAVYRIDVQAGAHILVSVSGFTSVAAYVLAPCSAAPATPSCIGSNAALAGNPINVTASFAGQYFIVVDSANAGSSGTYTLTVDVN